MKAKERHHLKQNEFAETAMRLLGAIEANRTRAIQIGTLAVLIVAVVAGYLYIRNRSTQEAGGALGVAMSVIGSPIAPAPTVPGAEQQFGTFPTEEARREAALEAFHSVAETYPETDAGITARYYYGTILLEAGRAAEAAVAFEDVNSSAGTSLYGVLARMGRAEALLAQEQYEPAIEALTLLAADRSGALPIDGVLMQLARASLRAGQTEAARAAFRRVVDEFPTSAYVAEAQEQLAAIG
jgi:tetratricopeptide (TPR) repeat protein